MKRLAVLISLVFSLFCIQVVYGEEWHPSKTNTGITIPVGYETETVNGTQLIITTDTSYQYKEEPAVIVSPVSSPIDVYTTEVYNKALTYSGKLTDDYLNSYPGLQKQAEVKVKELAGDNASTNNLRIHSIFDVWANEVARRIINEQGYVNVTVSLPGISSSSKYIAVHFPNNSSNPEVIPCTWREGIITLTLGTEFSPVMILSYETRKPDPNTSLK